MKGIDHWSVRLGRVLRAISTTAVAVTLSGVLGCAGAANADSPPPATAILKGTPISPADALAYYNVQGATATNGLCRDFPSISLICTGVRPPEVVELARGLKNDPNLIYEYIRNSIDTEFQFGLQKGDLGVKLAAAVRGAAA